MKRFTILFLVIGVGTVAIALSITSQKAVSAPSAKNVPQSAQSKVDKPGTIDGAKNPQMIPDTTAYSLLFDLIANRRTEAEKGRIHAYLRQAGLEDADSDALIVAAEEFRQQAGALDAQAASINVRSHTDHAALSSNDVAQLRQLGKQREMLVQGAIASLPRRLSVSGMAKLHQHINERVKRRTKISPDREPS